MVLNLRSTVSGDEDYDIQVQPDSLPAEDGRTRRRRLMVKEVIAPDDHPSSDQSHTLNTSTQYSTIHLCSSSIKPEIMGGASSKAARTFPKTAKPSWAGARTPGPSDPRPGPSGSRRIPEDKPVASETRTEGA